MGVMKLLSFTLTKALEFSTPIRGARVNCEWAACAKKARQDSASTVRLIISVFKGVYELTTIFGFEKFKSTSGKNEMYEELIRPVEI
jgi:hypothetical protein